MERLSPAAIQKMRRAGAVAAATLQTVGSKLKAGIRTADIDRWVHEDTLARGAKPSQLGYQGFPHTVCTSRNHVVCHGMPSERDVLNPGDIINVDITSNLDGYHGDTSATFAIGDISPDAQRLIDTTKACLLAGIGVVRHGAHLGDIGAAVEEVAYRAGYSVVEEFGGHGIGRQMHQSPHVSHRGKRGAGLKLKAGMTFTIEPMINQGGASIRQLSDGWTIVTADGLLSAQFEHTVLVTRDGCEVLTLDVASSTTRTTAHPAAR